MRALGWLLTVAGWLWAFNGVGRIIAGALKALPGDSGTHVMLGFVNLFLAALAIWGGGKLRKRRSVPSIQSTDGDSPA